MKADASRIGSTLFLRFLKLSAASENIFSRGSTLFPHLVETPVTKLLRKKLKSLITNEVQRKQAYDGGESKTNALFLDPLSIVQTNTSTLSERHVAMSKILIDECIKNLKDSTTPGPGTDGSTRDSLHPVFRVTSRHRSTREAPGFPKYCFQVPHECPVILRSFAATVYTRALSCSCGYSDSGHCWTTGAQCLDL